VRLFEHPEFEQAVLRAAEEFGLSERVTASEYFFAPPLTALQRLAAGETASA
jgi:hypothetical protein